MVTDVFTGSTLREAVAALERGAVVALPTETVYGLACDAANPGAVERLYALKGRPLNVPLPVALADASWGREWHAGEEPRLTRLAARWWPGPLTIVIAAREGVSERITAGLGTVALRVPAQPLCTEVIEALGRGVVLTSANPHGEAPAQSAEEVAAAFPEG
ncbi:MAG: L-threonylcarbamoyladenylate synthase, partial [Myxococcota bacterium]|nr:L-threonylcarbamoyladenylate synthase [Myxococcota bacterium]